ncbi:MAG: ATP-binding protein [Prevotellaceae bacterium]|jgi:hypothetical protein|nr:ATP-binding protein [Prevotellaceae bacterium]
MSQPLDILNSKTKKLHIELPNYVFNHSSSSKSLSHPSLFLGREKLIERLTNLFNNTSTQKGVYLITGNRGVGKSSLIEEVIKRTSLTKKYFSSELKFISFLLSCVLVLQWETVSVHVIKAFGFNLTQVKAEAQTSINHVTVTAVVIILVTIIVLLVSFHLKQFSLFERENPKKKKNYWDDILIFIKELVYISNASEPHMRATHAVKAALILSLIELCSLLPLVNQIQVFIVYLSFTVANLFWSFLEKKLFIEYAKDIKKKNNPEKDAVYKQIHESKLHIRALFVLPVTLIPIVCFCLYDAGNSSKCWLMVSIVIKLLVISLFSFHFEYCRYKIESKFPNSIFAVLRLILDILLGAISNYVNNYPRIYLKINFGQEHLKKRDVLRLIARSMQTEYNRFCSSIRHTFIWRAIVLILISLLTLFMYKSMCFTGKVDKFYEHSPLWLHCIFYLCLASTLVCILWWLTVKLFNITTHRKIKQQLKDLNDAITYNIDREKSGNIQVEKSFDWLQGSSYRLQESSSVKKSRLIADEGEIEKELQDILDNIQNIPFVMCRPEFIIVFDELDKVEAEESTKDGAPDNGTKDSLFSINDARNRQSSILKLLSNLKYFLTTANAQFIFIAGREMYDIYLADISDRNNHIGSIFNDVVYVPSFLSEHTEVSSSDMTSLTEKYVCKHIIPNSYPVVYYDLKRYKEYLDAWIYGDNGKQEQEKREYEQKKQKIIASLQQFIIYLAYTSKGAPKKMVQIFESYVKTYEKGELDDNFRVKLYKNSRFFLTFDYYQQFEIGMTSYLVAPIMYRFADSNIQKHSDKLLVSSLRFVDFLFKFYRHNFSWKNLSISPEMIEINRAPELQSIVNGILNYLTQIHVNRIFFGIYEFRFENLISQEMSFMTKISETFSALFNFALDESLALKWHYKGLLNETQERFRNCQGKERNGFINSISSLQIVLGDLYFYDDELEEAGIYYKDGIQILRENAKPDKIDIEELYLLVRNILKLGFVYEKRKQYDFAYLTYANLCRDIISSRNFDTSKMGIAVRRNKENKEKLVFIKAKNSHPHKEDKKYYDNIEVPECYGFDVIDENIAGAEPLFFKHLSPATYELLFRNSTFEGLKLMYVPFLAKFQMLEKSHFGGIIKSDIKLIEREFDFLTRTVHNDEVNILRADFYAHVGDILYYKNYDFGCLKDKKDDVSKDAAGENEHIIAGQNRSCSACYFYKKALCELLYPNDNEEKSIIDLLSESFSETDNHTNAKYCIISAKILSDWGNVFFACDKGKETKTLMCNTFGNELIDTCEQPIILSEAEFFAVWYGEVEIEDFITDYFWREWKVFIEKSNYKQFTTNVLKSNKQKRFPFTKMEMSMMMYSLSMKLYKKCNYYKRSVYQITKMLQLFKYYRENILKMIDASLLEGYIDLLSKNALRSIYNAYEETNILEIAKRKKDFDKSQIGNVPLQNILVDSEIGRIRILARELKLKLAGNTPEKLNEYYSMCITSPYGINYSVSARIYRLRLKSIVNWEAYQSMKCESGRTGIEKNVYKDLMSILSAEKNEMKCTKNIFKDFKWEGDNDPILSILEQLISDSIFCLKEIIRLSKTVGESYLFNHSFMGNIYYYLADWIILYQSYAILKEIKEPRIRHDSHSISKLAKAYEEFKIVKGEKTTECFDRLDNRLKQSHIEKYLEHFLGKDWAEQLSGYYETHQALSHYYLSKETHEGGRAYMNIIENMFYLKEDFNDRANHFNIAMERFIIGSGKIDKHIKILKECYEESGLHKIDNYFETN